MTPAERLVLETNIDSLWAQEKLREDGGKIKADALRRLVLLATGDEKAAEEAWAKRVHEEMRRQDFSASGG